MRVAFSAAPPVDAPAVAVGVWQGGRAEPAFQRLDGDGALSRAVAAGRFEGREGQLLTVFAPPGLAAGRVVIVGLGAEGEMTPQRAERLGGALAAELLCSGVTALSVAFDLGPLAAHVAVGLRLRAWRPPAELRGRPDPEDAPTLAEATLAGGDAAAAAYRRLDGIVDSVLFCRDLVVAPGNLLTPATFAEHALQSRQDGVAVEVLEGARLEREGLGLLCAVGRGSAQAPRLVVARWLGGAAGTAPWVFVGKGITFDSGGISIKHGEHVHEMKGDMGGAAAALGALRALALQHAPVNAVAVLALAENMPSGNALRPGDVIRAYDGQTVEVVDTDAEGRLVLADAVAWSCATLRPRAVIDLATLTGAVVVTLGRHHAGLFSADEPLAKALLGAGAAVGEPLWRLPLSESHDEALKSDIADMRNCAWGRAPDALHAARFLQRFVPDGVPWAHLDIAGVADATEAHPLGPKGPTGFGVRLLETLVRG